MNNIEQKAAEWSVKVKVATMQADNKLQRGICKWTWRQFADKFKELMEDGIAYRYVLSNETWERRHKQCLRGMTLADCGCRRFIRKGKPLI